MIYAIVRDRGMQYRVEQGQTLDIALIETAAVGEDVAFDEVLLVSNPDADGVKVGSPCVEGAKVRARVVGNNIRGEKIIVFRYHRRKRYRRRTGHRQNYTRIKVEEILV